MYQIKHSKIKRVKMKGREKNSSFLIPFNLLILYHSSSLSLNLERKVILSKNMDSIIK